MFQNKDPRKGRRRDAGWSHEKLRGGGTFNGWIAGDTVWVLTHWNYRSIPCYAELTDGVMPCPYCGGTREPTWVGYTPVYREDERPCVVIVPDSMRDRLASIQTFDPVKVFRGKMRGDTICVIPDPSGKRYHTTHPGRRVGADIRGWLLVLWREAPLREFYAMTDGDKPAPPPAAPEPAESPPPELVRIRDRAAAEKKEKLGTLGEMLDAWTVPGANGSHADDDSK